MIIITLIFAVLANISFFCLFLFIHLDKDNIAMVFVGILFSILLITYPILGIVEIFCNDLFSGILIFITSAMAWVLVVYILRDK